MHFDADVGSKAFISWRTHHPDPAGNCTLRLATSADDDVLDVMYPLDGSGKHTNGKFPCGRRESLSEGKEVRFPKNVTCDQCFIQLEWQTSGGGRNFMCADFETIGGKLEDCSG